jgi:hypothetical protein
MAGSCKAVQRLSREGAPNGLILSITHPLERASDQAIK